MTRYHWTDHEFEFITEWNNPMKYILLAVTKIKIGGRRSSRLLRKSTLREVKETCCFLGSKLPADIEHKLMKEVIETAVIN